MIQKIERLISTVDKFKHRKFSKICRKVFNAAIDHISKGEQNLLPEFQKHILTSDLLKKYFESYKQEGIPFENYAFQPVFVRNIKDLLNALYLLEKTFEDLESIDICEGDHKICSWLDEADEKSIEPCRHIFDLNKNSLWGSWWSNLKEFCYNAKEKVKSVYQTVYQFGSESNKARSKLWNETIPKAYKASHLITHLDFSLLTTFLPEYDSLKLAFSYLRMFIGKVEAYTEITPERVQNWIQPDQLGNLIGEGIYQLKAESGSFDISFLTHLSCNLPSFFQQLTDSLKDLSPDLSKVEPSVSKEQLDAFEELAAKIIVATDRLGNSNTLMLPFYVLNYIQLIRDIVGLGRSVIEQFSLANATSQEVVIDKLRKLKHEYIAPLMICLDKTEAELMLKPGILSRIWMVAMKDYWLIIVKNANKIINLKKKAPDLLILNDNGFRNRRILALEDRIDKNEAFFAINSRKLEAFRAFYRYLDTLENGNSVSKEDLAQLAKNYLLIQHFIIDLKPRLHAKLVNSFFSQKAVKNHSNGNLNNILPYIPFVVSWSKCKKELWSLKGKIESAIESVRNTATLNKEISKKICSSLNNVADFPLIPVKHQPLLLNHPVQDELIRSHMDLYKSKREQEHLNKTLSSLRKFNKELKGLLSAFPDDVPIYYLNYLSEDEKLRLSSLYASLQPYLFQCIDESQKTSWELFDRKLVQAFTGDINWLPDNTSFLPVLDVINKLSSFQFKPKLRGKIHVQNMISRNCEKKVSQHKENLQYVEPKKVLKRANYVFKADFSPKIPQWIRGQREKLFRWVMDNYSSAITKKLAKQSAKGLPFVEVENSLARLRQPQQLVVIKQMMNAFYYLERSSQRLVNLKENHSQTYFVYNLLQAYDGVERIYELGLVLKDDPYLWCFINQLKEKFIKMKSSFYAHICPYQTSSLEVNHHQRQPIHFSALWNTIQALRVMPIHLNTYIEGKPVNKMPCFDASYSAKKTCIEIQELMSKTNAYFKVFLSLPKISKLSFQLRDECLDLGQQVNSSVTEHLKQIQDGVLTDILIEADKIEISIGLKAGTISNPVRTILSKFFTELVFQQKLSSQDTFKILFSNRGWLRRIISIFYDKAKIQRQKVQLEEDQNFLFPALQRCEILTIAPAKIELSEKYKLIGWMRKNGKHFKHLEKKKSLSPQITRKRHTELEKSIYSISPHLKEDFSDFEFRIRQMQAKIDGEKASNLFAKEKQQHQLVFLTDNDKYLSIIEEEKKEQVRCFVERQFDKVSATYSDRTTGIETLSKEYIKRLDDYVIKERKRIVFEITDAALSRDLKRDDLDLVLFTEEAAKYSIGKFVKKYYHDYVKLCGFLNQLQFCKVYCQELWVKETDFTRQKKFKKFMTHLNKLDNIARNEELKPSDRIRQLTQETQKKSIFFSRLMNIRNEVEPFTWTWFKQCIEDLLAFLHLRKTTPQRHYYNICNRLRKPSVQMNQLYKANGFFRLKFEENNQPPSIHGDDPHQANALGFASKH